MTNISKLITDNIDIWTNATQLGSTRGRGNSKKITLVGVKKLRELILELAVHGKLVSQDSSDKSPDTKLHHLEEEKQSLIKEKKLKKQKTLPAITEEQIPFKIPKNWLWMRLPDVTYFQEGPGILAKDFRDQGVPLVRIAGMHEQCVSLSGCNYLDEEMVKQKWNHYKLDLGDIVLSSSASLGKVSKVNRNTVGAIVYTGLIRFKPYSVLSEDYMAKFFESIQFIRQINDNKKGAAIKHFGPTHLKQMIIPVPPLSEQKRIVVKANELMALCDQLEQQTEASIDSHQLLVEELLSTLFIQAEGSNSENAQAFEQNWARITEHFDLLFTTEHSIEQLKQTILQLAVMGKLVPMSTANETSMELLQRVESERKRLVAEEKLKTKANPKVREEDKYIKTPERWSWCRLGNLAKFIDYRGKTPTKLTSGVRLITAKNVKFGFISLEPEEFISEDEYVTWMTRGFPRVGDILFTPEAPLGNVAIIDIPEKFALAQRAICFQFHVDNLSPFFKLVLMSKYFQDQLIENSSGMTARGIKASKLKEIPIPVPPLNEQHKIVEVVNRFNSVCGQLQKQIAESRKTQIKLSNAIVEQALN